MDALNAPEPLETRLAALITHLSPSARKQMALSIARKLRARQQRNIKRRQAPDGAPFKPRKAQPLRDKRGRIGRKIFTGLRTAKLMKAKGSGDAVVAVFTESTYHCERLCQGVTHDNVVQIEGTLMFFFPYS